jgi:hypothetical protein
MAGARCCNKAVTFSDINCRHRPAMPMQCHAINCHPSVIYGADQAARQTRYRPQRQVTDLLPGACAGRHSIHAGTAFWRYYGRAQRFGRRGRTAFTATPPARRCGTDGRGRGDGPACASWSGGMVGAGAPRPWPGLAWRAAAAHEPDQGVRWSGGLAARCPLPSPACLPHVSAPCSRRQTRGRPAATGRPPPAALVPCWPQHVSPNHLLAN